ncbi:hypothetical protein Cgig2_017189 [Carnegiea gigantea]|uniref:Protein FAR1-RELATED SEQUENCE n=1 Tax=Carnegiea gigantea TaxID=171969 RepID=A0A9Q1Q7E9_9CARY|nr:hypothetical protein Cgig2_017189 [Carnegiea gigantea]
MSAEPHNERIVMRNFDLNEAPKDDDDKAKESIDIFLPSIRQCFLSLEEAFLFYKNFARSRGFSVRKGRSENKNGVKGRQDFFCSCEGRVPPKVVNPVVEQRNRDSHKCGCGSYMRDDHDHKLLSPEQVRFLSTYRSIDKETEEQILLFKKAGLSVRQIMHIIELENNVDLAIEDVEQSQLHHTMLETYRANPLGSMSPLEKQAFDILTPFCFKRFQDEFARASQYMMFEVNPYEFVVQHHGTGATSKHRVFWDVKQLVAVADILNFGEFFVVTYYLCLCTKIAFASLLYF